MSRIRTLSMITALGIGICAANPALAQSPPTECGIEAAATPSTIVYDPFAPLGLQPTNITLDLTRFTFPNGKKTDIVSFFLKSQTSAANGTTIVPTSVVVAGNVDGLNSDIFYGTNETAPVIPTTSTLPGGFLRIAFTGGNNASDTARVNFTVTLPPNLDLQAVNNLVFDVGFTCSTTGGGPQTTLLNQTIPNAVNFPIRVRSGLRAGFVGTALAFGEIGDLTTASLGSTPKYTPGPNHVRVQSSGPYSVELTSQNNYRMTADGTNGPTGTSAVEYELKFLGETRSPSNTTTITKQCLRAGVGLSVEDQLSMQAKLLEGGAGKVVSANYRDTLTVTVTPLAADAPGTNGECSNLSGQY